MAPISPRLVVLSCLPVGFLSEGCHEKGPGTNMNLFDQLSSLSTSKAVLQKCAEIISNLKTRSSTMHTGKLFNNTATLVYWKRFSQT